MREILDRTMLRPQNDVAPGITPLAGFTRRLAGYTIMTLVSNAQLKGNVTMNALHVIRLCHDDGDTGWQLSSGLFPHHPVDTAGHSCSSGFRVALASQHLGQASNA